MRAFGAFLRHPSTAPRLTQLLADNARNDAALETPTEPATPGPRQCCVDYAYVTACDGVTDTWTCGICGFSWDAVCPDTELWKPES